MAVPLYWLLPKTYVLDGDAAYIPYNDVDVLAAMLVAGAVVLLIEVLREVVEPEMALGAGLLVGLGTPVWSVASAALWTHTVTILVLAVVLFGLARSRFLLSGGALGWAVFARPTMAFVALVLGLYLARSRRSPSTALKIGIPSSLGRTCIVGVHACLLWYLAADCGLSR